MMDLKYEDLETFLIVYRSGTFTAAARDHGLTQSALSQKISRLEESLNSTLFVRHPRSLSLTPAGEKLLVYAKESIERQRDFLKNFDQYTNILNGSIRVAGFSSVMRSMILPKLAQFVEKHPSVSLEFSTHEMNELESILRTNKADFIITDYFPNIPNLESIQIENEEYVIIHSKKHKKKNTYIDHGAQDNATSSYFKYIEKEEDYKRVYLGDVYAIIDGVKYGIGSAVMSKHLIVKDKDLKIEKHSKKYIRPVVLSFLKQNYYSPLSVKVIDILKSS